MSGPAKPTIPFISTDNPHHKNEVLMQLFVFGPTWDGNLISKSDRDTLLRAGLASRYEGWNFLTEAGVQTALTGGRAARYRADRRWYEKAALHK